MEVAARDYQAPPWASRACALPPESAGNVNPARGGRRVESFELRRGCDCVREHLPPNGGREQAQRRQTDALPPAFGKHPSRQYVEFPGRYVESVVVAAVVEEAAGAEEFEAMERAEEVEEPAAEGAPDEAAGEEAEDAAAVVVTITTATMTMTTTMTSRRR